MRRSAGAILGDVRAGIVGSGAVLLLGKAGWWGIPLGALAAVALSFPALQVWPTCAERLLRVAPALLAGAIVAAVLVIFDPPDASPTALVSSVNPLVDAISVWLSRLVDAGFASLLLLGEGTAVMLTASLAVELAAMALQRARERSEADQARHDAVDWGLPLLVGIAVACALSSVAPLDLAAWSDVQSAHERSIDDMLSRWGDTWHLFIETIRVPLLSAAAAAVACLSVIVHATEERRILDASALATDRMSLKSLRWQSVSKRTAACLMGVAFAGLLVATGAYVPLPDPPRPPNPSNIASALWPDDPPLPDPSTLVDGLF